MSQHKPKTLKGSAKAVGYAITANHLLSGDAIYLSAGNDWHQFITGAMLFSTLEDAEAVAARLTVNQAHIIAGAYVIAMADTIVPLSNRERIRSLGPTNYFHGKQQHLHDANPAQNVA